MRHLTDRELARHARLGWPVSPELLAERFEALITEYDKLLSDYTSESDAVSWACACFEEHAGEDFHAGIVRDLKRAKKGTKLEMVGIITRVIRELEGLDVAAGNELMSMRTDGVQ